jgi:nucleoside 2-deoxyribosyltransferase
MKKIYLACPYFREPKVSFYLANKKAAQLMLAGYVVFSPVSHGHAIAVSERLGNAHQFWMQQDLPFIDWCDEVYVLMLPYWQQSKGVKAEIDYAAKLGKPIKYIEP